MCRYWQKTIQAGFTLDHNLQSNSSLPINSFSSCRYAAVVLLLKSHYSLGSLLSMWGTSGPVGDGISRRQKVRRAVQPWDVLTVCLMDNCPRQQQLQTQRLQSPLWPFELRIWHRMICISWQKMSAHLTLSPAFAPELVLSYLPLCGFAFPFPQMGSFASRQPCNKCHLKCF